MDKTENMSANHSNGTQQGDPPNKQPSHTKPVDMNKTDLLSAYTKALKKAHTVNEVVQRTDIVWHDNADVLDRNLLEKSEDAYIEIAKQIVASATAQLKEQNDSKNFIKGMFTVFFISFLSVQYVVLAVVLFIRAFQNDSLLSDTVIVTYISSVFLETLGAVGLMIKYAFDSQQETNVLEILKSIISTFQKFPK